MRMRILVVGLGLAISGAGFIGGATRAVAENHPAASATIPRVDGQAIVKTALSYLGDRYVDRGDDPTIGFDALGFVRWVYAQNGISLPNTYSGARMAARNLYATGLHAGHLIFFKDTISPGLSHVGIYIGHGRFVHAEWYDYGVVTTWLRNDPVDGNYWASKYIGKLGAVPNGPGLRVPVVGSAVQVAVASLNLRSTYSLTSTVLAVLTQGSHITVTAVHGRWVEVRTSDGKTGWVLATFVANG